MTHESFLFESVSNCLRPFEPLDLDRMQTSEVMRRISLVATLGMLIAANCVLAQQESELPELRSLDLSTPVGFSSFKKQAGDMAEDGEGTSQLLSLISEIDDASKRRNLFNHVLEEIAESDPKGLFDWLSNNFKRISPYLDEDIVHDLAKAEPLGMIQLAQQFCPLQPGSVPPDEKEIAEDMKYSLDHLCWFENEVVRTAFPRVAREDSTGAMELLAHWKDHRHYLRSGLISILVATSGDEQMEIWQRIEEMELDHGMIDQLYALLIPELGLRRVEELVGEKLVLGADFKLTLVAIVSAKYQECKDPLDVARWLEGQSNTLVMMRGVQTLLPKWMKDDAIGAINWIRELDNLPFKDRAIELVLGKSSVNLFWHSRQSKSDDSGNSLYPRVLELAKLHTKPNELQRKLTRMFKQWCAADRSSAESAFEKNEILSDESREELRLLFEEN